MLAGDEKVEKATAGEGSSTQQIFIVLCLAFCVGGLDTEMQGAVGEVHGLLGKMEGYTDVSANHVITWWAIPSFLLGFVGQQTYLVGKALVSMTLLLRTIEFMMSAASPFPKAIDEWR